jgi:hypothetical protein
MAASFPSNTVAKDIPCRWKLQLQTGGYGSEHVSSSVVMVDSFTVVSYRWDGDPARETYKALYEIPIEGLRERTVPEDVPPQ